MVLNVSPNLLRVVFAGKKENLIGGVLTPAGGGDGQGNCLQAAQARSLSKDWLNGLANPKHVNW